MSTYFIHVQDDSTILPLLLSKLDPINPNSIIIGLESAKHYADNLNRFLITRNYKMCVLNPTKVSSFTSLLSPVPVLFGFLRPFEAFSEILATISRPPLYLL